ncbi:hypothetical protein ABPG75_013849 [Micractinium tetrahymenae]
MAAALTVVCVARPRGQQASPQLSRGVAARAVSFPAQPQSLATLAAHMGQTQRLQEGPSCPWPNTSPHSEGQAAAGSPARGVWALLTGSKNDAATQPSERALPPEVERLACFSDGPGAAAEEPQNWLASWWRYQGP